MDMEGVRTTYGSTIFSDHVSDRSDYLDEILEANGAVVIGKCNTPELGAGDNTFNEVFGSTLNPWNRPMTCGGSLGGAAALFESARGLHTLTPIDPRQKLERKP